MALNRKVVEGWRFPDARPELDAIREDVLALMDGHKPEVKSLQARQGQLLKAIEDKDKEISELKEVARVAEVRAAEVQVQFDQLQQHVQEVEADRDALAAHVQDLEKSAVTA